MTSSRCQDSLDHPPLCFEFMGVYWLMASMFSYRALTADWLGGLFANAIGIEHAAHQVRFASHGRLQPPWARRLLRRLVSNGQGYPDWDRQHWSNLLMADRGFRRNWVRGYLSIRSRDNRRDVETQLKRVAEWFAVLFSRAATIGEMKGAA